MIIDIKKYLLDYIGSTSWQGETIHDNISSDNLDKLDKILTEIETLREILIEQLTDHRIYRKGNASAEYLHKKAKRIMKKHLIKEFTHTNFENYWEELQK